MKVNELFLATAGPMAEHGGGKRKAKRGEWRDDVARNEAERFFSGEKRACDAALVVAKLACAALAGMALSVLVANLFGVPLPCGVFYCLFSGRSGKHSGMAFLRVFGLRGGGRVTSGNVLSRAMDRGEARRKDAYRGWHPCSF